MGQAAILTVDDDPSVSRAIARDLRRRYGDRYRIVRASSGAEALEVLRELKLRGGRVAVVLADYRMPQMNGIEFLEEAMDLFPLARRALLTAYADTDAAIQAINVVDVDHYLLKPWDPPEEKLYPVLDSLLDAWQATADRELPDIRVVGHRWSEPSFQIRDFLARNLVPYRYFGADEPEGRRLLEAAEAGPEAVPLVVTADGRALSRPTVQEVARAAGLSTDPGRDFYDLIIVGGGPAGLGAAVYGGSEGLKTLLIERQAVGGQAGQSSRIENYLGFPDGISGAQLTDRARRQADKFAAETLTTREVVALRADGSARTLTFADGGEVSAHAVLLATGVSYRPLLADGVADLTGSGVFYGSAATEGPACAGTDVYIVGGANSAGQAALFFSRYARRVTLLVRGDSLEASMSYYLIQQLAQVENIEVRTRCEVIGAQGAGHLQAITVCDSKNGTKATVECGYLFVFIGAEPRTDWLGDTVLRDDRGFIRTGPDLLVGGERPRGWDRDRDPFYLESSVPGIFAAGDVRVGSVKRVASAVGEGAMAVALVHRYLEA
ncbi:fused response regulator/thioredoxin-disulfide reductase [Actinoplanes lobatus]|uniref:Fused response regulator/thioredoxin-disulfide reductase n=1 Tax=Actinoplanes lobatus TaxID=113568 RepID=A0A7W7H9B6_9ACTN|nr:FAD-dependent oxidoreductase [Actinoplanes lobatus]MBB4746321.1 thioredoxin reductase (NADPH) [Actinoplanes lobatus]GGN60651.1 fused response regulator/thioredoxin-disulfide reductase [Actinoplanes lobatus]GIE41211.1 fused response regulator/thioredoxin-disulfide reductase [Actinoplanes lobatus]